LRGRAGYAFGDTLVYATGGVAFMDVDEVSIGNTPGETAVNEDWRTGYVLGAGVEQAIAPGMTAKLEYLHMDFGTYSGFSDNNEPFSFDNRVDLIRAGLNFAF
jgi:outer membrane immunogenic protein